MNRVMAMFGLACLICAAVGCADAGLKPVTGMVTLDGHPADGVKVIFVPVEGGRGNSMARTDKDWRYQLAYTSQLTGTMPGNYKVLITKDEMETGKEMIPDRYSSGGKSTMRAEVTEAGDNVFNFEIESK